MRPTSETQGLLGVDQLDSFLLKGLEKSIIQSDLESCNSIEDKSGEDFDIGMPIQHIDPVNTSYSAVLEKRKGAITWKMSNIKGISPSFCTHKILMEDDFKPVIQPQRHLNPKFQDVVKNEIVKLLDSGLINPSQTVHGLALFMFVLNKGGIDCSFEGLTMN
ncbi:hypothetical protein Tco_0223028 [Tanacetum coccineum]